MRLILWLLAFTFALSSRGTPPPELNDLLADASKASEECKKWMEETKPMVVFDDSGERLKDKATALKILEHLEKGSTPDAFHKVYGFILRRGEKLTETEITRVHAAINCSPTMSSYMNYRRILKDVDSLQFTPEEKNLLAEKLLKHLKRDVDAETNLINMMVDLTLFEELIKSKLITVPKSISATLTSIKRRGEKIVSEARRIDHKNPMKFLITEMRKTDMIRKDFSHILNKTPMPTTPG